MVTIHTYYCMAAWQSREGQRVCEYRTMEESNVKPFERCCIINLLPGTAEEAKTLIPSLEASLSLAEGSICFSHTCHGSWEAKPHAFVRLLQDSLPSLAVLHSEIPCRL